MRPNKNPRRGTVKQMFVQRGAFFDFINSPNNNKLLTKILITGATGFIGSHLAELCVEKGFEVVAFDRYNPNNDWGWLERSKYKDDMEIILGDIRDYDSVSKAMKGCKAVFHMAALIGIPYSYVSPLAYIRTNIEGTYNVLESAKILELE